MLGANKGHQFTKKTRHGRVQTEMVNTTWTENAFLLMVSLLVDSKTRSFFHLCESYVSYACTRTTPMLYLSVSPYLMCTMSTRPSQRAGTMFSTPVQCPSDRPNVPYQRTGTTFPTPVPCPYVRPNVPYQRTGTTFPSPVPCPYVRPSVPYQRTGTTFPPHVLDLGGTFHTYFELR